MRSVLIQDGQSSHMTVELIQLAKENDFMPSFSHYSCASASGYWHFSSFKNQIGKALNKLIRSSPGRVSTTADIPEILSEAWPASVTAINLMSRFRKNGIHPLDPGCIKDRECAPSKAITETSVGSVGEVDSSASTGNSIETHAPDSFGTATETASATSNDPFSPDSALVKAMDPVFINPQKRVSENASKDLIRLLCLTEDEVFATLQKEKQTRGKKKSEAPACKRKPRASGQ